MSVVKIYWLLKNPQKIETILPYKGNIEIIITFFIFSWGSYANSSNWV